MTAHKSTSNGGAGGMLLLLSTVVFVIGIGFDFALNGERAFWIGAERGGRAVIAAVAVLAAIAMARLLRWALGRPDTVGERGGERGGD